MRGKEEGGAGKGAEQGVQTNGTLNNGEVRRRATAEVEEACMSFLSFLFPLFPLVLRPFLCFGTLVALRLVIKQMAMREKERKDKVTRGTQREQTKKDRFLSPLGLPLSSNHFSIHAHDLAALLPLAFFPSSGLLHYHPPLFL